MGDSKVSLYGGETLATIAGFPTIYYFQRSEIPSPAGSQKPLIICVPGGVHLGRIFYGGHDGSDPKDFLAHHLGQRGFDVLCLSYPLENNIMPPTAADFRVPDWGRQAALTAQQVIDDNALSTQSIVLIGWSMGGRMPVAFNIAAKELGLEVRQFISFCATPGISQIRDIKSDLQCSNAGYSSIPTRMEGFYQQLEEVNSFNGGREVIPRDIYFPQYTGAMPVNLPGSGLSYDGKGSFIKDAAVHERETSVFDIENQILSTALYPTGIMDAGHAIADKATWGFLLTLKLEAMVKQKIPSLRGTPKWPKLIELIHSAPNRLCVPVVGNHFFFVGKESACRAAEAVESLIDDTNLFREELSQLII